MKAYLTIGGAVVVVAALVIGAAYGNKIPVVSTVARALPKSQVL